MYSTSWFTPRGRDGIIEYSLTRTPWAPATAALGATRRATSESPIAAFNTARAASTVVLKLPRRRVRASVVGILAMGRCLKNKVGLEGSGAIRRDQSRWVRREALNISPTAMAVRPIRAR